MENQLILTKADFEKLTSLIHTANAESADLLEEELSSEGIPIL